MASGTQNNPPPGNVISRLCVNKLSPLAESKLGFRQLTFLALKRISPPDPPEQILRWFVHIWAEALMDASKVE